MVYNGVALKGIGGTCKDCTERHTACHDHCLKYQKAKAKWNAYREDIRKRKKEETAADRFKIESCIRNKTTIIDKKRNR